MPSISISATPSCDANGGVISGSWTASASQSATVSLYGTNTGVSSAEGYGGVDAGTFTFDNLPNDLYEVQVTGSVDGVSNLLELIVTCSAGGGGTGGTVCEIAITSVTITPGDAETATTATVNAVGSGPFEYSLDGGAFQSSNVFTVTPGTHFATVRNTTDTDCSAITSFLVSAPETLSVTSPSRDWLPVGQDINYTFTSPKATPQSLAIRIEVSRNGADFTSPLIAGVLILAPDSNKQYKANVAPYLEAMFSPTNPVLSGQDLALYKRYRLVAGELPGFNGTTGTAELTTPEAFCLYATELTPIVSGIITLSKAPNGVNSDVFPGVETKVDTTTNQLTTRSADMGGTGNSQCFNYPIQAYWLNRAGGWQTWVFGGKHEYEEETEEGTFWKDENDRTHLAHIPGITEKVKVFSGFIPLSAYNTVFGMLSAIRVYHRDNNVWREINIESGSYLKHKEGLRRKELNFSFTYAQTLTVQNA